MNVNQERTPSKELLGLDELKEKAKQTDLDDITRELVQLFKVSELDQYSPLFPEIDKEKQDELRTFVVEARSRLSVERMQSEGLARELSSAIDDIPNRESQPSVRSEQLLEVVHEVDTINQKVTRLIEVDDYSRQELDRTKMDTLMSLLDRYEISYNKELFLVYVSTFGELSGKEKLQKLGQHFIKSRSKEVHHQIYEATAQLSKKLKEEVETALTEVVTHAERVITDIVEQSSEVDDLSFLDHTAELKSFVRGVKDASILTAKVIVPDKYIQFPDALGKMVSTALESISKAQEQKLRITEDLSPTVLRELEQLKREVSDAPVLLLNTRNSVNFMLRELSEYSSENIQIAREIADITALVEQKQVMHTLIRQPELLKKKLYDAYLNFPGERAQQKAFLREAIHILRELAETQTEAFLQGYEKVWAQMESVGFKPIELTELTIKQLFLLKDTKC